jgi:hypothetical protein
MQFVVIRPGSFRLWHVKSYSSYLMFIAYHNENTFSSASDFSCGHIRKPYKPTADSHLKAAAYTFSYRLCLNIKTVTVYNVHNVYNVPSRPTCLLFQVHCPAGLQENIYFELFIWDEHWIAPIDKFMDDFRSVPKTHFTCWAKKCKGQIFLNWLEFLRLLKKEIN